MAAFNFKGLIVMLLNSGKTGTLIPDIGSNIVDDKEGLNFNLNRIRYDKNFKSLINILL